MGSREVIIKKLEKFKESLKNEIDIEKIIFFGSMASWKPRKDSDIDLIIVSENFRGKKFRHRAIGFYNHWNLDFIVDFLYYTPEEFNKSKKQVIVDFLYYTPEEFNKSKKQVSIVKEAIETGIEVK